MGELQLLAKNAMFREGNAKRSKAVFREISFNTSCLEAKNCHLLGEKGGGTTGSELPDLKVMVSRGRGVVTIAEERVFPQAKRTSQKRPNP